MAFNFNMDLLAVDYQSGDSDKRPFAFVHGNTQNDSCGIAIKDYFQQRGHTTLSYDLPGHGLSRLETADYVFTDLIQLNQQILNHHQLNEPILCGHSLGGMIQAGTIAKYQLEQTSLILCGSYDSNPLAGARKRHASVEKAMKATLDEYIAEGKVLFEKQLKYDYDYVLIDTPPILGVLLINALAACHELIMPVQTEYLAIKGLERMMRTLQMVVRSQKRAFEYTVVPTMFDRRTNASVDSLRVLRNTYEGDIWPSAIGVDTKFRDASKAGMPPNNYDPSARGVKSYKSLLKYLLGKEISSARSEVVQ